MIHKTTYYNHELKRIDIKLKESTNNKFKVVGPTNKKRYYKTLGTS